VPPAGSVRHAWTVPDTLRIGTSTVPRTLNPLLSTQPFEAALDRLFAIAPAIEAAGAPPITDEEILAEVEAVRTARRNQSAGADRS